MGENFKSVAQTGMSVFEMAGVGIIVVGFLIALYRSAAALFTGRGGRYAYDQLRSVFGRTVLLGLEVLVAADIIRTVAVDPTLDNMLILGLLILIRTFLSWSLEIELDGMVPWKRWQNTEATKADKAADEPAA